MANATNTQAPTVVSLLIDLMATVKPTILSGDIKEVEILKAKVKYLGELYGEFRANFDECLIHAQQGYLGADFLQEVTPIRKPREDAKPKVEKIRPIF